jgi:hypothetical protein
MRDRYNSLRYRLFGRCWSQGCGRLMVLHGPWRLARCWAENTPSAIVLPESDPEPAAPVSRAEAGAMGMVQ